METTKKKFSGDLDGIVVVVPDQSFPPLLPTMEQIVTLRNSLLSEDQCSQLSAISDCANLVSKGCLSIFDILIQHDIVPLIVNFLNSHHKCQLQAMAAWTLANIAGGLSIHTEAVVGYNAVPLLVRLLSSNEDTIKMQSAWALGNIICDSLERREIVLQNGALAPLLRLLISENIDVLNVAKWTLEKLCQHFPPRFNNQIPPVLPFLRELFSAPDENVRDEGALLTALRLLFFLDQSELYEDIAKAKVYRPVVDFLYYDPENTKLPLYALMFMGNLACIGEAQIQIVIDNGALGGIKCLLEKSEKSIYKEEACWTIANLAGGTKSQLQAVIEEDLITPMIPLLKAEPYISKHAARAIFNATCESFDQTRSLPCEACIEGLCDLMCSTDDPELLDPCLNALNNFLIDGVTDKIKKKSSVNIYAQMVENHREGFKRLSILDTHHNKDISDLADYIFEEYF